MYKGHKVSFVFSTYNEKDSIRQFINDVVDTKVVDEIVVVNNNAKEGTNDEVKKSRGYKKGIVKLVHEKRQGYGWGYRRALAEATHEIIVYSEADATFVPNDIHKLLAYSDDFDAVVNTRIATAALSKGANMGLFLKWGNWFIAKLVEVLYGTTQITDAGGGFRLIKKKTLKKIQPHFREGGSVFGLEFLIHLPKNKVNFIEIPLLYRERVGQSSVTGNKLRAFMLGLDMVWLAIKMKFR